MIEKGLIVKLRNGDTGIVVETREGFARVSTEKGTNWYPVDELEYEFTLEDRLLKSDFDDGLDFILAVDSYRLLAEYKFNPYVLASSTKISILEGRDYIYHSICTYMIGLEAIGTLFSNLLNLELKSLIFSSGLALP